MERAISEREKIKIDSQYKENTLLTILNNMQCRVGNHCDVACPINNSFKPHKTALFASNKNGFNVWFVFIGYFAGDRIYKCVYVTD